MLTPAQKLVDVLTQKIVDSLDDRRWRREGGAVYIFSEVNKDEEVKITFCLIEDRLVLSFVYAFGLGQSFEVPLRLDHKDSIDLEAKRMIPMILRYVDIDTGETQIWKRM